MSLGYPAARATDPIGHNWGMVGMLAGAALGVALIVGGVLTGGTLFLVAAVAVAALSGAALAHGIQKVTGSGNPWTGNLGLGSPNVRINGLGAARVMMDFAAPICNGLYGANHYPLLPMPPIAEGNPTIRINGMLAARIEHKLVCAADITDGSPNVLYGAASEQVLTIIDTEQILSLIGTGILIAAFGIEAAIIGYVVTSVIGDAADKYLGEGWGDIINGTLGFLALGLGGLRQSGLKNTLRESVRTDAEGLSELPFKERGPVVARATDLKTGKLSEPYTNVKKMPEDLHPLLEERANELKNMGNEKPHYSEPGTHAEVLATNELLKAREAAGETVTRETLKDIVTDQYWLDPRKGETGLNPAKICPNCTHTLEGTTSSAGKKVGRGGK